MISTTVFLILSPKDSLFYDLVFMNYCYSEKNINISLEYNEEREENTNFLYLDPVSYEFVHSSDNSVCYKYLLNGIFLSSYYEYDYVLLSERNTLCKLLINKTSNNNGDIVSVINDNILFTKGYWKKTNITEEQLADKFGKFIISQVL